VGHGEPERLAVGVPAATAAGESYVPTVAQVRAILAAAAAAADGREPILGGC
jgi:hypothetical protein